MLLKIVDVIWKKREVKSLKFILDPNGFCLYTSLETLAVVLLVLKTKEPLLGVLHCGPSKHQFWTPLGRSVGLDTTIDSGSEFEWYKKEGVVCCPWKQRAEPKKVKNVKGEKGISGCTKIFSNWKEYKQLGSRQ